MGKYEGNQGKWEMAMGRYPIYFKDCGVRRPLEDVRWYNAVELCNWLSELKG